MCVSCLSTCPEVRNSIEIALKILSVQNVIIIKHDIIFIEECEIKTTQSHSALESSSVRNWIKNEIPLLDYIERSGKSICVLVF